MHVTHLFILSGYLTLEPGFSFPLFSSHSSSASFFPLYLCLYLLSPFCPLSSLRVTWLLALVNQAGTTTTPWSCTTTTAPAGPSRSSCRSLSTCFGDRTFGLSSDTVPVSRNEVVRNLYSSTKGQVNVFSRLSHAFTHWSGCERLSCHLVQQSVISVASLWELKVKRCCWYRRRAFSHSHLKLATLQPQAQRLLQPPDVVQAYKCTLVLAFS